MDNTQRHEGVPLSGRVLVSNSAANMISSLHPFDESEAKAVLETVKSSVLDASTVKKIAGVDDTFVARVGQLRVIFKQQGDAVVITSVVAQN
jgi:mRNA-degrading endonuclease RelE of RelBE toxin-antitoxin system